MKSKDLTINDLDSRLVNKEFLIRLDGYITPFWEIHSAVGYYTAVCIGQDKFKSIVIKALKKGGDITRLKINHELTCTLYTR